MLEEPFIYVEANSRLQDPKNQKKKQNREENLREATGTSCNLQLGVWDPSARRKPR